VHYSVSVLDGLTWQNASFVVIEHSIAMPVGEAENNKK
jgi:hypothetical protein